MKSIDLLSLQVPAAVALEKRYHKPKFDIVLNKLNVPLTSLIPCMGVHCQKTSIYVGIPCIHFETQNVSKVYLCIWKFFDGVGIAIYVYKCNWNIIGCKNKKSKLLNSHISF